MADRGTVTDYAGEALYTGDLINYPSRRKNGVRAADAIIREIYFDRVGGRLFPMLKVEPTGMDSGHVPRRSLRMEHVATTHARLLRSNVTGEQDESN
ncbi:hypothetical protein [Streptomyces sp. NPDC008125]|uniref:hypothetical protein n=1 Tax=Streptomyces sp. NPDC008125 TaxID=3364811 RepID=UPI0036E57555